MRENSESRVESQYGLDRQRVVGGVKKAREVVSDFEGSRNPANRQIVHCLETRALPVLSDLARQFEVIDRTQKVIQKTLPEIIDDFDQALGSWKQKEVDKMMTVFGPNPAEAIRGLYWDQAGTVRDLAGKFGVGPMRFRSWMWLCGIETRGRSERTKLSWHPEVAPARKEAMTNEAVWANHNRHISETWKGRRDKELAVALGVETAQVSARLSELYQSGLSAKAISRLLGIGRNKVIHALHDCRVSLRQSGYNESTLPLTAREDTTNGAKGQAIGSLRSIVGI